MKNIFLFFALLIPLCSFAQLDVKAEVVKEKFPEIFTQIKQFAMDNHSDDPEMATYSINKNCAAYVNLMANGDKLNIIFFLKAVKKYVADEDKEKMLSLMNENSFDFFGDVKIN